MPDLQLLLKVFSEKYNLEKFGFKLLENPFSDGEFGLEIRFPESTKKVLNFELKSEDDFVAFNYDNNVGWQFYISSVPADYVGVSRFSQLLTPEFFDVFSAIVEEAKKVKKLDICLPIKSYTSNSFNTESYVIFSL